MTRASLLLTVLATALGLCTLYLYREHAALDRTVALEREQCAQQIEQLRSDYRAQIAELQQYMLQ